MYYKKLTLFQTRFTKAKRRADNIFIIKTLVDKAKTGRVYWSFVDFEKAFESINREVLHFKMMRMGASENMVNSTKNVARYTILFEMCKEPSI